MNKIIFFYLFFINIISFLLMYIDKKKAIKSKWRISEKTLFTISFFGGSIGNILGIYMFRHKTKHLKFTLGIPFILLCQILLI